MVHSYSIAIRDTEIYIKNNDIFQIDQILWKMLNVHVFNCEYLKDLSH